jgi:GNAT superfamily N-acetyltransferase
MLWGSADGGAAQGWLDLAVPLWRNATGQQEGSQPMPPDFRPFTVQDMDWLVTRHGDLYARDEGFDASFPALVREIAVAFLAAHDATCEAGWIVWNKGARVGSIFVVKEAPEVAKLRLVLLEPEMRGTGLAQAMLERAMGFARDAGYRRMRLWTHESHRAAGRMYARNGFALEASEPRHSFGVDVVAQFWTRDLVG